MYTQCPHCQTCFRIAEAHLKVANGKVRCGSCQEVFDATRHLFKNLTDREPITDYQQPAPTAKEPPAPPPEETEHIDLSRAPAPKPRAVDKILHERQKAPPQDRFMESTMGNDRYNDLDRMKTIDIPGDISVGDSTIKSTEARQGPPTKKPEAKPAKAQESRTPYEDIENKEAPTTTSEQDNLKNFFAEVDAQLQEGESRSKLDKDIDELLAFANASDRETDFSKLEPDEPAAGDTTANEPKGIEVSEEFDMDAIADFEKELEATSTGVFSIEQPADMPPGNEPKKGATASPRPVTKTPSEAPPDATPAPKPQTKGKGNTEATAEAGNMESKPAADEDVPRVLRHSLEMLNQGTRRSLGKTLLMSLLILLLLGGLGFQFVLFRNVELAHWYPKLIPLLNQACNRLPCRYSGKVDVSQIKLISRDVRSDPNHPNALLISATFVDQAPYDQPYPIIKITLYDLGGNVVASRRFTPKEYLAKMYNRYLLMESGTPVHITLAVLDPGKDAINFEFSFL